MTKFILEIRNELSKPEKVCNITFKAEQEFQPEKGTRIFLNQLPLTESQVKSLTECPSMFQNEDGQYLPLGKILEGASLCVEKKQKKPLKKLKPNVNKAEKRQVEMKKAMLNNPKHLILKAPHPSPLSVYRGFWGCGHFAKCNEFLIANGQQPIDWQIENI